MELNIVYKATNSYQNPVSEAIFEFLLIPENSTNQIPYNVLIENSLQKNIYKYKNLFGFEVFRIRTTEAFYELKVTLNASVITKNDISYTFKPPGRSVSDNLMNDINFQIDHHIFLKKSKYTYISIDKVMEAVPFEPTETIFDFATKLNNYLFENMEFTKGVTNVETLGEEAFLLKKGVSQDFAHIFIGICRSYKIPARYVSGYLNQDAKLRGNSMHAWAEILIPTIGWMGFDPVNNNTINENYIKVCHGEDYKDCAPIKGVLFTMGESNIHLDISVRQTQQ